MELQPWVRLTRTVSKCLQNTPARHESYKSFANLRWAHQQTNTPKFSALFQSKRSISSTTRLPISIRSDTPDSQPSEKLSHNISQEEKDHYRQAADQGRARQIRTPWQREGPDTAPAKMEKSEKPMSEGKILTTPSRMLKLILPLVSHETDVDDGKVEPLALVVHPQQPLSYLERLIQAELLPLEDKSGKDKMPAVYFRAQNLEGENNARKQKSIETDDLEEDELFDGSEDSNTNAAAKHKEDSGTKEPSKTKPGPEAKPAEKHDFVRWSSSTEVGGFIRNAAPAERFTIEIEGAPRQIAVTVPSFEDRSYYLRMRLRKTSKKIAKMADIKRECDTIAHKAGQRVATGGFVVLCGWWYLVYRLTFLTDLGWDVMEPVTYLVGLSTLICGYVWFLYHNREVSYRSALNFTISRQQAKLYREKSLDLPLWESLIEEGNALRREIKSIAMEYDVDWDESKDAQDMRVVEELKKKREKEKRKAERKDEVEEPS